MNYLPMSLTQRGMDDSEERCGLMSKDVSSNRIRRPLDSTSTGPAQSHTRRSRSPANVRQKSSGISRSDLLLRFAKYCIVGGSGVFVDMGILYLLADPNNFALNITVSKIAAAEIAMSNNFVWNELWTFRSTVADLTATGTRSSVNKLLVKRFLLFNVICSLGIAFSTILLHLFYSYFGWNLYISNLVAILVVTCWNFGMNARFNWSLKKSKKAVI